MSVANRSLTYSWFFSFFYYYLYTWKIAICPLYYRTIYYCIIASYTFFCCNLLWFIVHIHALVSWCYREEKAIGEREEVNSHPASWGIFMLDVCSTWCYTCRLIHIMCCSSISNICWMLNIFDFRFFLFGNMCIIRTKIDHMYWELYGCYVYFLERI
jgi:hypothetical protein